MRLDKIKMIRRIALPLLANFANFDIDIRHHYTQDLLHLNIYKHKGYWYHGLRREHYVMTSFKNLIRHGDTVVEVGGHIGYVSLYFAKLVGNSGRVFVFEPGENNLPYAVRNLRVIPNIVLIPKAASNCIGQLSFYLEDLTGQNNSLVRDFWAFSTNVKRAFVPGSYRETVVEAITLDHFVAESNCAPTFIKIDVEGAELDVLQGAVATIRRYKPTLMVEVNIRHKEVYEFVRSNDYVICDDKLDPLRKYQYCGVSNIFCLHREHAHLLKCSAVSSARSADEHARMFS